MAPTTHPSPLLFLLLAFFLTVSVFHGIPSTTAHPAPPSNITEWKPVQNVSVPRVQAVATFTATEINKQANKTYAYIKVLSGEYQLVDGATNYRLQLQLKDLVSLFYTYEAVVHYTPWDNVKTLTSYKLVSSPLPLPPSTPPPSQWTPFPDLNAPKVQNITRFTVGEINKQAGKNYTYVKVLAGEYQLVDGATNYRLQVQVKDSTRLLYTYKAVVRTTLWDGVRTLTSYRLLSLPPPPPSPPQWVPIPNVNTRQVQGIGMYAVTEINRRSISFRRYAYVNVVSGETQTLPTGGVQYLLVIRVREGFRSLRNVQALVKDCPRQLLSYTFLP